MLDGVQCTIAPPGEYDRSICAGGGDADCRYQCAIARRSVAVSTCFLFRLLLTLPASSAERLCNGTVSVRPAVRLFVCPVDR